MGATVPVSRNCETNTSGYIRVSNRTVQLRHLDPTSETTHDQYDTAENGSDTGAGQE